MKPKTLVSITVVALLAVLLAPAWLAAQHTRYKLVDLGTLGGPNSYLPQLPPFHSFLPSSSISAGGTFAGYADTPDLDPFCFNDDCHVSHAVAWRHGIRTDLGTLPGGANSAATWISNHGLIVGVSQNGKIDPDTGFPASIAVQWKDGQITSLGTLEGGYNSQATAINGAGQVVGFATNTIFDPNSLLGNTTQARAFLWQNGTMQDLGTLQGGTDAMALFINERGQIVGQSYSANSVTPPAIGCAADASLTLYGFFWDKGRMTDIGTLGGSCTNPYSLNNRGEVVGQSNIANDVSSHPFLWRPEQKMKDLGALGGNYGFAEWLNDFGTVVGSATNPGDQALLAFQWKDGVMTDLGTLAGNACSAADAINSHGLVVGGSGINATPFFPACTDLVEHAVLWDHGHIIDLNGLILPGSDLTLNEAFFINDRDEIAGIGTLPNQNQHAFLLIPCGSDGIACQGVTDGRGAILPNQTSSAVGTNNLTYANEDSVNSGGVNSARQNFPRRLGLGRFSPVPGGETGTTSLTPAPIVTLSPTSLTFATQAISTTTGAKTVALKNAGTASLTITSIAIIGTNAGDFAQTHTCKSPLSASASCSIGVTFTPTVAGTRTAALSISDNATGSPQKVSLFGIGTTAKLSPASLNFGTVAIGSTSSGKTVTLANVGKTTFTISGIAITGANPADFAQTHTCGSSLVAGASCSIIVSFKPTASGTRIAAVSVSDSAAGSPQNVSLSGNGANFGGRCTRQGMQCPPQFPPCCPGLVCTPASTRAFCKPAGAQGINPRGGGSVDEIQF